MIHGHVVGLARARTCGDHDALGAHAPHAAVGRADLDHLAGDEARPAVQALHMITFELLVQVALVVCAHGIQAAHQARDLGLGGHGDVDHALAARAQAEQVTSALAQRLARNRAALHALAARGRIAVDDQHALTGLGSLDRGLVPGRTGTEHEQVDELLVSCDLRRGDAHWKATANSSALAR